MILALSVRPNGRACAGGLPGRHEMGRKASGCAKLIAALTMAVLLACNRPSSEAPLTRSATAGGEAADRSGVRTITAGDLRFDSTNSTPVISSAQKFIIPVPAFGGEPLVYPKGDPKAGQPIVDYEGKPIGARGLIFFNDKDRSIQAVAGDGQGVIIINEVTAEQAEQLYQKVGAFRADPNELTLSQMKQLLEFARTELHLGDMYNSTRSFARTRMTPALASRAPRAAGKEIEDYGLKKRDDRDICHAVFVPGKFAFEGPAATAQVFENGGVIVEQSGAFRGVQPEIFVRTYRLLDGRAIVSPASDLKGWR